jgi:fructose-bisphosphate aldolase/2-amino-3,7-dideoxy-D-threo-hept-6-ulosonate synthase
LEKLFEGEAKMKELRLRRLYRRQDQKLLIIPLDHGITYGPINGISNIRKTVATISTTKANAIILHKGNIVICKDLLQNNRELAVILHLNASVHFSPNQERKIMVASIEEALQLGVDAVSIHINIGNGFDHQMLHDFGEVSEQCQKWGMPLLAMLYPRGKVIDEKSVEGNLVAARVAMEIGADFVKIGYTGDPRSFEKIVKGVDIPLLVAGGDFNTDNAGFINDIKGAIQAGAAGVAIGRNIFQRNNVADYIAAIYEAINPDSETNSVNNNLIAVTKEI